MQKSFYYYDILKKKLARLFKPFRDYVRKNYIT